MTGESPSPDPNSGKQPTGESLSNKPFAGATNIDLQQSPTSATDDERLLERYLVELESGKSISPEQFLDQHNGISESKRGELLQSLRSLQLVYTAGRHLTPSSSGSVPEGVYSLGDFQILRPLGRGGMGVVFLARQLSLDRVVALKILFTAGIPDPSMRARFQIEARAAATLHHPHIVPVYAIGHEQEVDFYAMQFIAGHSLHDELRGRPASKESQLPVSPTVTTVENRDKSTVVEELNRAPEPLRIKAMEFRRALRIAEQIADALSHAHRSGIIHRDVKPSNILLDEQDQPWLADFGLAQMAAGPDITAPGAVLGTLRYMSPEQLDPENRIVDHRTDIYSLGATLYEMLAGRPAFDGRSREELSRRISEGRIPALRSIRSDIPRDVATVVHKALEPEATNRYANASELAADLRACLDQRPILAKPPTWMDRVGKWSQRNRKFVQAASLVGVVALIAMTAAWWRVSVANRENKQLVNDLSVAKASSDRNLDFARQAVNEFFSDTSTYLREIPGSSSLRQQMLKKSEQYYQALLEANTDSQLPLGDLAWVHYQLAAGCFDRQQIEGTAKHSTESLRLLSELENPNERTAFLEYRNHLLLGQVELVKQLFDSALIELNRAAEIHASLETNTARPETWFRDGLVISNQRANLLADFGKLDEASLLFEKAVKTAQNWLEKNPADIWAQVRLVELQLDWAQLALTGRKFDLARELLAETARGTAQLSKEPSIQFSARKLELKSEYQAGKLSASVRDMENAKARFERASQLAELLSKQFEDQAEIKFLEISSKIAHINILATSASYDESHEERIADIEKELMQWTREELPAGVTHSEIGSALHNVGLVVLEEGDLDRAAELFGLAREQTGREVEKNPEAVLAVLFLSNHHYSLARVRFEQGNLPAAVKEFVSAAKWRRHFLERQPENHHERMVLGEMHMVWPKLLGRLARWQEAADACESGVLIANELIEAKWEVAMNEKRKSELLTGLMESACFARNARQFRTAIDQRFERSRNSPNRKRQLKSLLSNLESLIPDPLNDDAENAECLRIARDYLDQLGNELSPEDPRSEN